MATRKEIFDEALFNATANGATIVQRSDTAFKAVVAERFQAPGPNHLVHFLLTLFTGGLWLIVWVFLILASSKRIVENRILVCVDAAGNVETKPVNAANLG